MDQLHELFENGQYFLQCTFQELTIDKQSGPLGEIFILINSPAPIIMNQKIRKLFL